MTIKELKIKGYKSIGEITLHSLNPFTVFVGANGAGKSNIFEALEFLSYCNVMDPEEAIKYFGKIDDVLNKHDSFNDDLKFSFSLDSIKSSLSLQPNFGLKHSSFGESLFSKILWSSFGKNMREKMIDNKQIATGSEDPTILDDTLTPEYLQFTNFTRLFIGKTSLLKKNTQDDSQLSLDSSNLEKVLKRILHNNKIKSEIIEILQLLIPGFDSLEIVSEELSGTDTLLVYEDRLKKPLTKRLISDGTYNILAILAAIYQSDTPQFLCIEEPENGLNPKVVRELVNIIRTQCTEKGHYIWLNTHSQTLVSELRPEEIILVDKVNGMTQTKQVTDVDLHGLRMDEALLTNSLGGGIPW